MLSDRACLGRTCCYTGCGGQAGYLLTRWENGASASMVSPVSPHTVCLPGLDGVSGICTPCAYLAYVHTEGASVSPQMLYFTPQ